MYCYDMGTRRDWSKKHNRSHLWKGVLGVMEFVDGDVGAERCLLGKAA